MNYVLNKRMISEERNAILLPVYIETKPRHGCSVKARDAADETFFHKEGNHFLHKLQANLLSLLDT